ncbi:helix-turn-helix domain-containing protein (plasmid) [Hafnia alvei]|nr:helix-turn-helix domain-containing protein [Hafnia alvei]
MNTYYLRVTNIYDVISQGYDGITLIYVIKGSVLFKKSLQESILNAGNVVLLNKDEAYRITKDNENIVMSLEISSEAFFQTYEVFYSSHFTVLMPHQTTYKEVFVEQLKKVLSKMIMVCVRNHSERSELEINSCLYDILLILVRNFKDEDIKKIGHKNNYSKRIENVTQWIKNHYQYPITLKEMAEKEYVSMAYLSRLFKQEVGTNFLHYLMQVRFSHSIQALISTKESVFKISQNNGFSSIRQFTLLFKEHYNTTPRLFRKSHGKEHVSPLQETPMITSRKEADADLSEVLTLLAALNQPSYSGSGMAKFCESEELDINLSESPTASLQPNIPRKYIIILGNLDELLSNVTQQQLIKVKKDIGLDHIDIYHSIFTSVVPDIDSMTEDNFTARCYSEVNRAISFLKENSIGLLVRIDASTELLDVNNFMRYCSNIFGVNYMQTWRFIYCSQPECGIDDLLRMSMSFRHNLQGWLGNVKYGVVWPQTEIHPVEKSSLDKYKELIKHIDFIGYASSYPQRSPVDRASEIFSNQSASYIINNTSAIMKVMKQMGINVPLYLLGWNTLVGNAYYNNDSFFRGAMIFKTIMSLPAKVAGVSLWLNIETQQAALKSVDTKIRSLALFHLFTIPRPVFQVLKFHQRLEGGVIASGDNYLITKTYFGYQIYLGNSVTFNPVWDKNEHLLSRFRKKVTLKLSHVFPGFYQIKQFKLDQKNGAFYWKMEQMQTKLWWDDEVLHYLDLRSIPTLNISDEHIDGVWTTVNDMDINAMVFYELRRVH